MKALIIINTITNFVIIALFVRHSWGSRLEFEWRTTFFGKVRHGLSVTLWELPLGTYPNEGRTVFSFNWRNPKTIADYPYIKPASVWALPSISNHVPANKRDSKVSQRGLTHGLL